MKELENNQLADNSQPPTVEQQRATEKLEYELELQRINERIGIYLASRLSKKQAKLAYWLHKTLNIPLREVQGAIGSKSRKVSKWIAEAESLEE